MKRSHVILSSLAAILAVAMFWMFGYQPQREALEEVEQSIEAELAVHQQLRTEIARLQGVRAEAPEIESQLAASNAIVPRDAALPSSLRQLQLAADESGVILQAVNTGRPAQIAEAPEGLSSISINMNVLGSYFQVVDFLRRVEDPSITPRGLLWSNAALTIDEYPILNVSLQGELFTALEVAPPPQEEAPAPAPDGEGGDTPDDGVGDDVDGPDDGDVDVAMEAGR